MIQAFVGEEIDKTLGGTLTNSVSAPIPDGGTVIRIDLLEDVQFTPRIVNEEALETDSPDGRVTVDNSDEDATVAQSKELTFTWQKTVSESNTVGLTFSTFASVTQSFSTGVTMKGVFDVGSETSFTAGAGFSASMISKDTYTGKFHGITRYLSNYVQTKESYRNGSCVSQHVAESESVTDSSPVSAGPGQIVTGTIYVREVDYVMDWTVPANVYYLRSPNTPVMETLTGVLEGNQGIDTHLEVDVIDTTGDGSGEEDQEETQLLENGANASSLPPRVLHNAILGVAASTCIAVFLL